MTRILLIGGSPIHPCKAHSLLDYAKYLLENQLDIFTLQINTLLVRSLLAEDLALGRYASPALVYPRQLIEEADGIIIVSPIIKTAYTGLLKSFLDILPNGIFDHKVILPLATSHTSSHSLAIDYSLKPVLTELGATHILNSVFAVEEQIKHNQTELTTDLELSLRLQTSLQDFLEAIRDRQNKKNNPSNAKLILNIA
ncbi:MAG: NADPH-dependent FMN reductase [Pseudanabaena sp.]|jgi:FMN reductase|nr:NADPH-dependent FMN reductase [Pseudanabaena sp. M046S1SP1A06QC]